jgi:hypothetical protein
MARLQVKRDDLGGVIHIRVKRDDLDGERRVV